MERNVARVMIWVFLTILMTVVPCAAGEKQTPELTTVDQKFSYAMGVDVAQALKRSKIDIDLDIFIRGAMDGFKGAEPLIPADEMSAAKKEVAARERTRQEKELKELAEKNLAAGEAFLAENKKREGVHTTESGLQYQILREGEGRHPVPEDKVLVHYRAFKIDETEYDSSYKRDKPLTIPVNGVLPGWTEALQLMKAGSKFRLFMPSKLAYGNRRAGSEGEVGPNETLIYEVELLKIEEKIQE